MVAEAKARLDLDGTPFKTELKSVAAQGDGLKSNFDGIGVSGGRMFSNLQKGAGSLGKSIVDVSGDFKRYEGIGVSANDNIGKSGDSLLGKLKSIGPTVAAAFVVKELVQFGGEALRTADEISDLSDKIGISGEAVQALQQVSKETGIEFTQFEGAILKANKASIEARAGNKGLQDAFENLGISIDDLSRMNPEELFSRVAGSMANANGDAETLSSVFEIIGSKSGPALQAALEKLGSEGLDNTIAKFKEMGLVISDQSVKALAESQDKIEKYTQVIKTSLIEGTGKLITIWEDFFTSLKGGFDASSDDYKNAQEQMQHAFEVRMKEKQDLAAKANKADEAEKALLAEITELEKQLTGVIVDRSTITEKADKLRAEISDLEKHVNDIVGEGVEIYRNQLKTQVEIKTKREELAKLEKQMAADWQKYLDSVDKQEAQLDAAREKYLDRVAKAQYNELSNQQKLVAKQYELTAAKEDQARIEAQFGKNSAENYTALNRVLDIEGEITQLGKTQISDQEKASDLTEDQVESLKKIKDLFSGMTENEVKDFVASLVNLATELQKVPKVGNLGWLQQLRDISDIVRNSGFDSDDAKKYGQNLAELARVLSQIGAPNLDWLSKLRDIGDIVRGSGFNRDDAKKYGENLRAIIEPLQGLAAPDLSWLEDLAKMKLPKIDFNDAKKLGDAIKSIMDGFKGIQDLDLGKIAQAVSVIQQLKDLGPGAKWEVEVKIPDEFSQGIPLAIPDDFASTLNGISASLKTLAGLKGIIWK